MNYYNPYFSTLPFSYTPTIQAATSPGLFGRLFGSGGLSTIINGAQKTLGIVNQTIPLVKQMSPVVKNAKTMFKVMNEFKRIDNKTTINNNVNTNNNITNTQNTQSLEPKTNEIINTNGPTFFL